MLKSTEFIQLFRSPTTQQVIGFHVTEDNPPQYLYLSGILPIEAIVASHWVPIDESEYLGMPIVKWDPIGESEYNPELRYLGIPHH